MRTPKLRELSWRQSWDCSQPGPWGMPHSLLSPRACTWSSSPKVIRLTKLKLEMLRDHTEQTTGRRHHAWCQSMGVGGAVYGVLASVGILWYLGDKLIPKQTFCNSPEDSDYVFCFQLCISILWGYSQDSLCIWVRRVRGEGYKRAVGIGEEPKPHRDFTELTCF